MPITILSIIGMFIFSKIFVFLGSIIIRNIPTYWILSPPNILVRLLSFFYICAYLTEDEIAALASLHDEQYAADAVSNEVVIPPEDPLLKKEEEERAFWASPEGQKVRAAGHIAQIEAEKAERLAQIEAEKDARRKADAEAAAQLRLQEAEALAKLRLSEQSHALEMAKGVANEEEARKEREFNRLKEL
jgi:hypothetical protein